MKDNLKELLFGKDYSEKHDALMEKLDAIEQKHLSFFKARPPKYEREEHDRLYNHYNSVTRHGTFQFGFNKDSDVPMNIQDECMQAFRDTFNPQDA